MPLKMQRNHYCEIAIELVSVCITFSISDFVGSTNDEGESFSIAKQNKHCMYSSANVWE